ITALGQESQVQVSTEVQVRSVEPGPHQTRLSLHRTTEDPVAGEAFGIAATVVPGVAGGTVEFLAGDEVLATAGVRHGRAQAQVRLETSGEHVLHAHFVPDDPHRFTASDSQELILQVGEQPVLDAAIELSGTEVAAGADLSVIGSSFGAGESASITLHSDPVSLGKVQANDAGEFK